MFVVTERTVTCATCGNRISTDEHIEWCIRRRFVTDTSPLQGPPAVS